MNRRRFFGALAAVLAAPRAVRLLPVQTITTPWIKLADPPLKIVGIQAWLPDEFTLRAAPWVLDRAFAPPMTVADRPIKSPRYHTLHLTDV